MIKIKIIQDLNFRYCVFVKTQQYFTVNDQISKYSIYLLMKYANAAAMVG